MIEEAYTCALVPQEVQALEERRAHKHAVRAAHLCREDVVREALHARRQATQLLRVLSAECLATCIMMLFGQGVCAQMMFSKAVVPHCAEAAAGSYLAVNFGWGAGDFRCRVPDRPNLCVL